MDTRIYGEFVPCVVRILWDCIEFSSPELCKLARIGVEHRGQFFDDIKNGARDHTVFDHVIVATRALSDASVSQKMNISSSEDLLWVFREYQRSNVIWNERARGDSSQAHRYEYVLVRRVATAVPRIPDLSREFGNLIHFKVVRILQLARFKLESALPFVDSDFLLLNIG